MASQGLLPAENIEEEEESFKYPPPARTSMMEEKSGVATKIKTDADVIPVSPFAKEKPAEDVETTELAPVSPVSKRPATIGDVIPVSPVHKISFDPLHKVPDDVSLVKAPEFTKAFGASDVVNFLFGDEMGIVGIKQDAEGFSWEWENAQQQWSEVPLWRNLLATTSLFGSMVFPALRAAHMTTKVGRTGELLGKFGSRADEVARWKATGILEKGAKSEFSFAERKMLRVHENSRLKWAELTERRMKAEKGELPLLSKDNLIWQFQKGFTNGYFEKVGNPLLGQTARGLYHDRLNSLWKAENLGAFFTELPEAAAGPKIAQHWLHQMDPNNIPSVSLSSAEKAWADNLGEAMRRHNLEALDSGMITKDTHDRIPMHFPVLYKGTPTPTVEPTVKYLIPLRGKTPQTKPGLVVGTDKPRKGLSKLIFGPTKAAAEVQDEVSYIALSTYNFPKITSDTLRQRKADLPEVFQRLQSGNLITDPADLTVRGYVMDRMLLNNFKFVRDIAMDNKYSVSHADLMLKYGDEAAAEMAGYVRLSQVGGGPSEIVGRMIEKAGGRLGVNGELPWVRREVFDEVFGADGLFGQTQAAATMLEVYTTIFKSMKTATSIPTHFQNLAGNLAMLSMAGMNPLSPRNVGLMEDSATAFLKMSEVFNAARKAGHNSRDILNNLKFNLGKIKVDGKTLDLNDELLDPDVRELIVENSFDATEGFSHLKTLFGNLRKEQRATRATIKSFLKMKDISQFGGKVPWLDKLTKAYIAEDMVPKTAYYLNLRAKGLTKEAALLETGRRLPMYNSVGSSIRQGRKVLFPWATFSTEAMRITKNNMMDYPIRMLPWLHFPSIVQSVLSGMEGTGYEGVQEAERTLPIFAQGPTTVVGKGSTMAAAGGATTGAMAGGAAGLLRGGVPGAFAGGLLGAGLGALAATELSPEDKGDQLRGALIDWLPHSSFMVTSTSPEVDYKSIPTMLEQLPTQPLAVLKPIMDVWAGETGFGAEIGSSGALDSIGKSIAGLIGTVAPPFIQKYGFKVTTPDVALSEQLFGKALPGDITNISRALVETGITIDPATGRPGSLSHDFLLNNFGMWKSYAAEPSTRLTNEQLTERNLNEIRTYLAKNLEYYLANGQDGVATRTLAEIQGTFSRQYIDDPVAAQVKWGEWVKSKMDMIGRHPRLKGWSEDELMQRFHLSNDFAAESRSQARKEMTEFLKNEIRIRNLGQVNALKKYQRPTRESGRYKRP